LLQDLVPNPVASQAVGLLLGIFIDKNTLEDLVTSRLTDVRRSRPRLAMLAFRFAQTRITLRLSNPVASQAVGLLLTIKKPTIKVGF